MVIDGLVLRREGEEKDEKSFIIAITILAEIMNDIKSDKRKNYGATTNFLLLGAILIVASVGTPLATTNLLQPAQAFIDPNMEKVAEPRKAPVVVSGDNIYIAWWTNNTAAENGNEEVMFRASTDGGATFSNRTNLSNTTDADSWRVEMHGEGDTVVVSWWEMNQTSDIPVARVSNDAGATFGPLMILGLNGTLGSGEAEPVGGGEEEEEVEEDPSPEGLIEEAVGG
jgi:hypothetical protein